MFIMGGERRGSRIAAARNLEYMVHKLGCCEWKISGADGLRSGGKGLSPVTDVMRKLFYASGIKPGTNSSCFPFPPCGMALLDRKGVTVVTPTFLCESMATRRSSFGTFKNRVGRDASHHTIAAFIPRSRVLLKSNRQTPLYLVFPAFAGSDPKPGKLLISCRFLLR